MLEEDTKTKQIWYSETITHGTVIKRPVINVLNNSDSIHEIQVLELPAIGKASFLNGLIQSASADEFYYHESLVHPALCAHKNPKKVLIAGGGELCTLREVIKHKSVEKVDMVDIDEKFVQACIKNLDFMHNNPQKDSRANLYYEDFKVFIENIEKNPIKEEEKYDVIIYDLIDPTELHEVGYLYTSEFFNKIKKYALKEDGIFVTQSTSLHSLENKVAFILKNTLKKVFKGAKLYSVFIPSFYETWSFVIANYKANGHKKTKKIIKKGKKLNKVLARRGLVGDNGTKYYDKAAHVKMFINDKHLKELGRKYKGEIYDKDNRPSPSG